MTDSRSDSGNLTHPFLSDSDSEDKEDKETSLEQKDQREALLDQFKSTLDQLLDGHPSKETVQEVLQSFRDRVDAKDAAKRLADDLCDQTEPWTGWKTMVLGLAAIYAALSSASTQDHFVRQVLEGDFVKPLNIDPEILEAIRIGTTSSAGFFKAILSFPSNFDNLNSFLRSLPNMTSGDFIRNALPALFTIASAVVSFELGWVAWASAPMAIRATLAAGQAFSALNTNGMFAGKLWKNILGNRDNAIIHLIQEADNKLKQLASTDPTEYVRVMSTSGLYDNLMRIKATRSESKDEKEHHDKIFDSLLKVVEGKKSAGNKSSWCNIQNMKIGFTGFLSIFSSFNYFKTGQKAVPDLFGIDSNTWGGMLLGDFFGLSSYIVNASITAIASAKEIDRLTQLKCSCAELCFLLPRLILLLAQSSTYLGMALEFPLLETPFVKWGSGILSFVANFAIGDYSLENFFRKMYKNATNYKFNLMEGAKEAVANGTSLEDHYASLDTPASLGSMSIDKKACFIDNMEAWRQWAFNSLTDFYNNTNKGTIDAMLTDRMAERLNAFDTGDVEVALGTTITIESPSGSDHTYISNAPSTSTPIPHTAEKTKVAREQITHDSNKRSRRGWLALPITMNTPPLTPSQSSRIAHDDEDSRYASYSPSSANTV